MAKTTQRDGELVIQSLAKQTTTQWVMGTSPIILNTMSWKAKQQLLSPRTKTKADKANNMKHDPLAEYRNSCLVGDGATRIKLPATMFKAALCNAALEASGVTKAQIGRLVWVNGDTLDLYGVPQLFMSVVRSADVNHTPDIRTRAIIRAWAVQVPITFITPTLSAEAIIQLLAVAGMVIGVGDFRQEKGKGNYGQFACVNKSDVDDIVKSCGIKEQIKSLDSPDFYDEESKRLFTWFSEDAAARGKKITV